MRHFEMAYATLYTKTLILYTFWWHDQPQFVYGSMYFDIYLSTLSMDTCILIYIFFIYVHNDIHINLVSSIVQFIVDHVYSSCLWNIINFDYVCYIRFKCNNFLITFNQPLLSNLDAMFNLKLYHDINTFVNLLHKV